MEENAEKAWTKRSVKVLHSAFSSAALRLRVEIPASMRQIEYWHAACKNERMDKRNQVDPRTYRSVSPEEGTGPDSAGQSGDTQGLSDVEGASNESVAELLEEGQFFEAEVVSGVENAPDADVAEVHTREVPEDDVPGEYSDADRPDTD